MPNPPQHFRFIRHVNVNGAPVAVAAREEAHADWAARALESHEALVTALEGLTEGLITHDPNSTHIAACLGRAALALAKVRP